MFELEFDEKWDEYFLSLDKSIQIRIYKKIKQIKHGLSSKHMQKGLPYFKENVGQYRITYVEFSETKIRRLYFVGTHKEYEKWINEQMSD